VKNKVLTVRCVFSNSNKTIDELIEECFRLYVERKLYGDEKYGKSRT